MPFLRCLFVDNIYYSISKKGVQSYKVNIHIYNIYIYNIM